jgi:prepilin-type N-terminal cleavage/methylation domain-containing protein
MFKPRRGAFTLIELLVVVAIIALLIALLLPSLARSKELARRTVCGTQLKQLAVGMRYYGNEFSDFCSLGVQGSGFVSDGSGDRDKRDASFGMYSQNGAVCGWLGLGMPWSIGAFTGNGPYFCPSAMLNLPDRKPMTTKNQIYPSKLLGNAPFINQNFGKGDANGNLYDPTTGTVPPPGASCNCQSITTYSVRPTVPIGETQGATGIYWIVLQGTQYTPGDPRYYDVTKKLPPGYAYDAKYGTVGGQGVAMPKFANLRGNVVIASDFVCGRDYIDVVHKEGVNVVRADGAATWVNRAVFEKYLSWKPADWTNGGSSSWNGSGPGDYDGQGAVGETNPSPFVSYTAIWNVLDRN